MRLKFKKWIELSLLHDKFPNPSAILRAVMLGSGEDMSGNPWWETVSTLNQILEENTPKKIPLFREGDKTKPEMWDYDGREWFAWSHSLAKAYGWTLDYIAELDFDDALALIQEILTEQQLTKEWQWQLSEIAYPYNADTKKSEFKELPRPSFMRPPKIEQKPTKIPRHMLPVGLVLTGKDNETIDNHTGV